MADAIKWALLLVLLLATITSIIVFADEIQMSSVVTIATQVIGTGVSVISPYLKTARELLNCFVPARLLTVGLYVFFFGWIFRLGISISTSLARFIYK